MVYFWWALSVVMVLLLAVLFGLRVLLRLIVNNLHKEETFQQLSSWQQFKMFQDLEKVRSRLFMWSVPVFIILCFAVGGVAAS